MRECAAEFIIFFLLRSVYEAEEAARYQKCPDQYHRALAQQKCAIAAVLVPQPSERRKQLFRAAKARLRRIVHAAVDHTPKRLAVFQRHFRQELVSAKGGRFMSREQAVKARPEAVDVRAPVEHDALCAPRGVELFRGGIGST